MAEIRPFFGWRYNPELRGRWADLLTPPYDVISPEMRRKLLARHERSFARIDLPRLESDPPDDAAYARAGDLWRVWKADGTFERDRRPAFYVYEQEFDLPGRGRRTRRGFLCEVRLRDYADGVILGHEQTFALHRTDRIKLMRATRATTSAIFSIYDDPERRAREALDAAIEGRAPESAEIDGVVHRAWVVDDEAAISRVGQAIAPLEIYIADGHHRYETALAYRDERRGEAGRAGGDEPHEWTLMHLVDSRDEGLAILPTHRILKKAAGVRTAEEALPELAAHFRIEPLDLPAGAEAAAAVATSRLSEAGARGPAIAVILPGGPSHLLRLREGADLSALVPGDLPDEVKRLDVTLLHRGALPAWLGGERELGPEAIDYVKDAGEVVARLREGDDAAAGFLLNPTRMDQVVQVSRLGLRMPQKSTYFYPKIITGLVARDLE
jgi:uncharacterized protein (DUF1015 family)